MKISYIAVIALICLFATACRKKDATPAGSMTISGDRHLLQPLQFTANGTKGHKVFWDFGDQQTSEGIQVSHVYNHLDSFTVSLRLDDSSTQPVATTAVVITTGVEKYAGMYHWHVHYSIDSVYVKSERDAERDIAITSTGNSFVQVGSDDDGIVSHYSFNYPAEYTLDSATEDKYTYKSGLGILEFHPKTGEISFTRVIAARNGGIVPYYRLATYTK